MNQIIVTLTTIPSRLKDDNENGIRACINSLVNQSYENYEIHFNIPIQNKLTGELYDPIPEWILEQERITVFRVEDRGPVTKTLETVKRVTDPNTTIIVVDDDLVYHEDMITEHIINQEKFSNSVVGYDGLRSRDKNGKFSDYFPDSRNHYFTAHRRTSLVDILQHYKSVSYKRYYFEEDFFEFINENYHWNDDLLLAAYFSYKKRDRICTYHESDKVLETFDEWLAKGGVHSFPVIKHTAHEGREGCNLFREQEDTSSRLYEFIDSGYDK